MYDRAYPRPSTSMLFKFHVIFVDLNADSVVILVQLAPSGVFQPQETGLEHLMPFFYICHFKMYLSMAKLGAEQLQLIKRKGEIF